MRILKIVSVLCLFACSKLAAQDLSQKANDFLNALSPELKQKAQFEITDNERFNFNFVPIERKGITFHDLNDTQKKAAIALLRASTSDQGFQKANDIMELEKVLIVLENQAPDNHYRDPLNYHFLIFGNPSTENPWGWRFEGHHISLNFFSTHGVISSSTPSFFGSNPGIVKTGEQRGKQALQFETDLGFRLLNSFSKHQLGIAHISPDAPKEIITGNDRKGKRLEPVGIGFTALTEPQRDLLVQLINVYVNNYEFGFAKTFLDKIRLAGMVNLTFAWAGGMQPGTPHYYRIQGPMLLIEYDNTQNNANHVHTIVRDLTNDFAEDILREHYRSHH